MNTEAKKLILSCLADMAKAEKSRADASKKAAGFYATAIKAGALCKSSADWDETVSAIEHDIRHNVSGVSKSAGLAKIAKGTNKGLYALPGSWRNIKSTITASFENGLSLKDADGNPVSVAKARQNVRAAKTVKAAETAKSENPTGYAINEALAMLAARLSRIPEPQKAAALGIVTECADRLGKLVPKTPEKAKRTKASDAATTTTTTNGQGREAA